MNSLVTGLFGTVGMRPSARELSSLAEYIDTGRVETRVVSLLRTNRSRPQSP